MLLQALEEQLLHACRVGSLLGVGWVCGHANAQLLLLALCAGVEGQDVLPVDGLGAHGLDLLHMLHLQGSVQQVSWGLVSGRQGLQLSGMLACVLAAGCMHLELSATEVLDRRPHVVVGCGLAAAPDHWESDIQGTCSMTAHMLCFNTLTVSTCPVS